MRWQKKAHGPAYTTASSVAGAGGDPTHLLFPHVAKTVEFGLTCAELTLCLSMLYLSWDRQAEVLCLQVW